MDFVKCLITGGAGFIGSSMADRLLSEGKTVVVYDNLSTGMERFVEHNHDNPSYELIRGDLLDFEKLLDAMKKAQPQIVFHFAANADIRHGTEDTRRDLEQNTIATYNVLETMRLTGCREVVFSSTGPVYGEPEIFPTPENAPFPIQTSLYGASKLAGEALIQAFCEAFDMKGWIYRFVSILGERYTHGHVFDFCKALTKNPERLRILGNGKQRKSYLYIQDCLDAILLSLEKSREKVNIFNLGTNEYVTVDFSADIITRKLGLKPEREYTGGERGWVGDSPFVFLDISKIRSLGFEPKVSIEESIIKTVEYLSENGDLLEMRE